MLKAQITHISHLSDNAVLDLLKISNDSTEEGEAAYEIIHDLAILDFDRITMLKAANYARMYNEPYGC